MALDGAAVPVLRPHRGHSRLLPDYAGFRADHGQGIAGGNPPQDQKVSAALAGDVEAGRTGVEAVVAHVSYFATADVVTDPVVPAVDTVRIGGEDGARLGFDPAVDEIVGHTPG